MHKICDKFVIVTMCVVLFAFILPKYYAFSAPTASLAQSKTDDLLSDDELRSWADEFFYLTNQERLKAGISQLTRSEILNNAAMIRAQEIKIVDDANGTPHTRPDGRSFKFLLRDLGIKEGIVTENIARHHPTPQKALNSLMNSEDHQSNILQENYESLGVGVHQDQDGSMYWIQIFMSSSIDDIDINSNKQNKRSPITLSEIIKNYTPGNFISRVRHNLGAPYDESIINGRKVDTWRLFTNKNDTTVILSASHKNDVIDNSQWVEYHESREEAVSRLESLWNSAAKDLGMFRSISQSTKQWRLYDYIVEIGQHQQQDYYMVFIQFVRAGGF